MMMYSRNGGIEVAEIDAKTAARNFPHDWTLEPWTRPDGRPDVFIRPDWQQALGVAELIDLARSTVIGRGLDIETAQQAHDVIDQYLAGTKHPAKAASATPAPPAAAPGE